jgi:hypothetical protein
MAVLEAVTEHTCEQPSLMHAEERPSEGIDTDTSVARW